MHPSPRKKIVVLSILFLATLGSYWLVKKSNRFSGTDEMGQRSIASKTDSGKIAQSHEKSSSTGSNHPGTTSEVVSNQGAANGATNSSTSDPNSSTHTGINPITGTASVPGVANQAASNTASPAQPQSEPVKKLTEGCFTVTYVHKKIASHADGEACLRHKNLIVLNHPEIAENAKVNPKSICVRVNGAATKFTLNKSNQIVIGPEAGPNAKITARYCVGKSTCQEDCTIKKDEFMSALGADESGDSAVDWDGSREVAKEDSELESEMAKFNQNGAEKRGESNRSDVFEGWISEAHAMACEQKSNGNKKVAQLGSH